MGQSKNIPNSTYKPLTVNSPRHASNSINNGSQAADDEYYFDSTVKSNDALNGGEVGTVPQYITGQSDVHSTQVKHIPVTVL